MFEILNKASIHVRDSEQRLIRSVVCRIVGDFHAQRVALYSDTLFDVIF